jgi:hypothetical protein
MLKLGFKEDVEEVYFGSLVLNQRIDFENHKITVLGRHLNMHVFRNHTTLGQVHGQRLSKEELPSD